MDVICIDRALRTASAAARRSAGPGGAASIDLKAVQRLDTAGAWLLQSTMRELAERGWQVEWAGARAATPRCWRKSTG